MAVLTGTITNAVHHTMPLGPVTDSSGNEIMCTLITVNVTGTYVQNDNAQVLLVGTAIENLIRDGKTVGTLLDVSMVAPGDENGTAIGVKTLAISTQTITFELTGGDLTTEHAGALLGAFMRDIGLMVTYKRS